MLEYRKMKLSNIGYINQIIADDTEIRKKIREFNKQLLDNGEIKDAKTLFEEYDTGEAVYSLESLKDFRDIHRYYESLGAKVKLQYIDIDLIYEVINFPDTFSGFDKGIALQN